MPSGRSLSVVFLATALLALTTCFTRVFASPVDPPRPVLVELFTSEGCSSCPPADDLLRKLNGITTNSGQLIVGISEHVTYWNNLGWADPYSQPVYTDRQSAYSQRLHLEGVYTPQVVVNGEQDVLGSDGSAILRAIRAQARPSPVTVHINSAVLSGNALAVTFSVTGEAHAGSIDIIAAIVDDTAASHVLHGENSGRLLAHVSVARSITRIATLKAIPARTLSANLATSAQQPNSGHHLILFAQAAGQGRVFSVESKAF